MSEKYEARNEALIRREEKKLERLRARADASEDNFKKTFSNFLKQAEIKRNLALDAQAATKDPTRVTSSRNIDKLRESFVSKPYESEEVITGMEDRPWERD